MQVVMSKLQKISLQTGFGLVIGGSHDIEEKWVYNEVQHSEYIIVHVRTCTKETLMCIQVLVQFRGRFNGSDLY